MGERWEISQCVGEELLSVCIAMLTNVCGVLVVNDTVLQPPLTASLLKCS